MTAQHSDVLWHNADTGETQIWFLSRSLRTTLMVGRSPPPILMRMVIFRTRGLSGGSA
jgi:hypothetical protein